MFSEIFLFELKYRLRRPAFYIYFLFAFGFAIFSFATGSLPVQDKEMINAPVLLAMYCSLLSVFLLLVSSAIMGTPLYRDIEHGTKEYYLSYPITRAGYFWGRFLGSFVFVLVISMGVLVGAWLGSKLGPVFGWQPASRYGKDHLIYYLYPFLTLIVPTLFFTSSLFFGLVAVFRNVKVIYSSGMFLFLGYIISNFFLHNIHNSTVIWLSDPFCVNGLRMETSGFSAEQLNGSVVPLRGAFLENRILWTAIGLTGLLLTWFRFSFERFFSGSAKEGRSEQEPVVKRSRSTGSRLVQINLRGSYYRKTLFSLTRIEILNIVRDNYFWIILTGGLTFLFFIFWHVGGRYGVGDFTRTTMLMDAFGDDFIFFIFLLIVFYTGETVHREKLTRYALVNDALPPPTWVLNSAKLISLCCLALFLALTPVLLGLVVQLLQDYTWFNLPQYFSSVFLSILPRLIEMVLFCYTIHIVVNNKFAAHGIAITFWAIMMLLSSFNYFNYNLLLYSYTPSAWPSDMDGFGHMAKPIGWFQLYWTIGGALLVVAGSLFYPRGVSQSFREKKQLALQRFHGWSRIGIGLLLVAFLATGAWLYYNVSYLNTYLTTWERNEEKAVVEKQLKKYAGLPLPRITRIELNTDLFPDEQRATSKAYVTILNRDTIPIDSLLLDGDGLDYTLSCNGQVLAYRVPLYLDRGKFNPLRPRKEPSDYRLYWLPSPLLPGDSVRIGVSSTMAYKGFQNGLYAANLLRNGLITGGFLPGLGYDEEDELKRKDVRADHGLPERKAEDIPHNDPAGQHAVATGFNGDLVQLDLTVSTSADQYVVSSGSLEKEWMSGGRHYFHYVTKSPGIYPPFGILSARYAILKDTVQLEKGQIVNLAIYYNPPQGINLSHYTAALKDGLRYFSHAFGRYPFDQLILAEGPGYGPNELAGPNMIVFNERNGWNANLRDSTNLDYIYYNTACQLARQWWGGQVMPNNTVGSKIISEGLARYSALCLMERKYGRKGLLDVYASLGWDYSWGRRTAFNGEHDLLHANGGYLWNTKAGMVLYGLGKTIGEDSLNTALHAFKESWGGRNGGPYAGSPDLYKVLEQHVPDSMRYYLSDSWLRVAMYDNRITAASVAPPDRDSSYRVTLTVDVHKRYSDKDTDTTMNDYIDIAVRDKTKVLTKQTYRWTTGRHTVELIVRQRPTAVEIDPDRKLLDLNREKTKKDF